MLAPKAMGTSIVGVSGEVYLEYTVDGTVLTVSPVDGSQLNDFWTAWLWHLMLRENGGWRCGVHAFDNRVVLEAGADIYRVEAALVRQAARIHPLRRPDEPKKPPLRAFCGSPLRITWEIDADVVGDVAPEGVLSPVFQLPEGALTYQLSGRHHFLHGNASERVSLMLVARFVRWRTLLLYK